MLRSFLIYLSKAVWAQKLITNWGPAWKAASRFIAGESISDAISVVHELNLQGIYATLDQLGEHTSTIDEAKNATEGIIGALEQINRRKVKANVSIKLTQIGLGLDEKVCSNNLERILLKARDLNNFIRIDMEDTPYLVQTLRLLRNMREKGFLNLGIVIQSYLFRSEKDTRELISEGLTFRLVKGAYKEPADLAFPRKSDVDKNFDHIAKILIDGAILHGSTVISKDGLFPPVTALGTHDNCRIESAIRYQVEKGLPKEALEIQMLYGIRRDLQDQTVVEGYPVRVYVPFGKEWYPYFVRRLAERPANLWFFVSNLFRR